MARHYSLLDKVLMNVDSALQTTFGTPITTARENPADKQSENEMSDEERKLSASLMRINHAGEVSAQGLYQGQALTAKLPEVREQMEHAAIEENDHLDWCEKRCHQLQSHTSFLGPFWYAGSFTIGAIAGLRGDQWSLGFVSETEHQVVKHLNDHLKRLPKQDDKSRAILEQMKIDELNHAKLAESAGAAKLPGPVKVGMQLTSKIMTKTAYYI